MRGKNERLNKGHEKLWQKFFHEFREKFPSVWIFLLTFFALRAPAMLVLLESNKKSSVGLSEAKSN